MNIIQNIIYYVLSVQEKFLRARLNRTLGIKERGKRKRVSGNGYLLDLNSIAEQEKNKMEEELSLLLRQTNYEPEKILEYIEKQGTKVYYITNPKYLYSAGENEGFIYPQKGTKALYFALLTGQNFKLKTEEMFVMSKGTINKFCFVYHLYNWYAYKHGISGMDSESITMLNKYLFNATDEEIGKLQLEDIYKLKDAIRQDKASIEFVIKLCKDLEGAQKAFGKLTEGGTNI